MMFDPGSLFAALSSFSLPGIGINLLDLAILAVVLFYVREGYSLGFAMASLDLFSFIVSFIFALKLYPILGKLLVTLFSIPIGIANAGSFFLIAFVFEISLALFFRKIIHKIPPIVPSLGIYRIYKKIDHLLGIIPGILSSFIVLAFIMAVVVALPASPLLKNLVTNSLIGSKLVGKTSVLENKLNTIFGGALSETLNFLTVAPQSDEFVNLNFKVSDTVEDYAAEMEMLRLLNNERIKAGVSPLVFDNQLASVARMHSRDMFEKGYFSHNSPVGQTPFDRMDKAGINYNFAGENLALAPSTELAMQGLINSPGHRKNILDPNFRKVGIGVIDGGIYGKMFSQEFTD